MFGWWVKHIDIVSACDGCAGLRADDIEPLHCEIVLAETTTSLYSLHGACHVNRISVQPNVPTKLSHGE